MSTKSFEVPYFYNQVTEVINVFGIAFVEFEAANITSHPNIW